MCVRVAVQINLSNSKRLEHRRKIICRKATSVEVGGGAQECSTQRDASYEEVHRILQRFAVDHVRSASSAIVHQEQIVAVHERRE